MVLPMRPWRVGMATFTSLSQNNPRYSVVIRKTKGMPRDIHEFRFSMQGGAAFFGKAVFVDRCVAMFPDLALAGERRVAWLQGEWVQGLRTDSGEPASSLADPATHPAHDPAWSLLKAFCPQVSCACVFIGKDDSRDLHVNRARMNLDARGGSTECWCWLRCTVTKRSNRSGMTIFLPATALAIFRHRALA